MPDLLIPETKKSQKAIIIASSVLTALALFFLGLTGYYLWQLRYGNVKDVAALNKEFMVDFSVASSATPQAQPITNEQMLSVVRPHNPVAGNPKASITIVAFLDFECPYSRMGYPIFKNIMDTYGPAVRVVFKHFPLEDIHPNAMDAGIAAGCAQEQNKFWPYYDLLFTRQQLEGASLQSYAQSLGLNMTGWTACVSKEKQKNNIEQDLADGDALGVRGTPTYFVNGRRIEGVVKKETWDNILIEEIGKKK